MSGRRTGNASKSLKKGIRVDATCFRAAMLAQRSAVFV